MEKNIKEKISNCNLKNANGITLVALVVTIIVLLILAAVSLSAVFSQDGIFSRAENATDKYGQAKARETLELVLSEFQITKYEEGLSGENYENRLDSKIEEVGSLIPKEDENSKYQLVIVDGHIFEIDRSVPKIVDYKGPADGIIITAQIKQNGDWQNPVVTVTGTITKYGGGSVTSSTATATEGVTIAGFPTTGGNYTIPNITKDTDITITASADDGKPAVTKTIKVRLIRDNTPPIISDQEAILSEKTAILNGMKIRIKANAVDNESGLKSLTYTVSPTTVEGEATGTLTSGEPKEIITTLAGDYTITFTATDNANNTSTATVGPITTNDTISVEDAKREVTSMNKLQEYVGTKVDYKTGETWQVFYYDQAGEFGPVNTLYLKKAYIERDSTGLSLSTKDAAIAMMRRMNPQWANSSYSEVDQNNEKSCAWLCDTSVWNSRKNNTYSTFAIGGPSVEMYIKAFNVWKTGNKDANNLVCRIENSNGYSVGVNGSYSTTGTGTNTLEFGPNNVFTPPDNGVQWWLASPVARTNYEILNIVGTGTGRIGYSAFNTNIGVCPIVPLDI